jgi:hypothetical protein
MRHSCMTATLSKALISLFLVLWASPARAGEVAVTGRLGYLSEWEITATARPTATGRRKEFTGPLVMKHVGVCMPNGSVEKSGEVRFWRTGLLSSRIEGVLTFEDEQCSFEAQEATQEGLMQCPHKGGVPLSLKIE